MSDPRTLEYERAAKAARRSQPARVVSSEWTAHQRHAVDLAAGIGARLEWLRPETKSAALVGEANGVAVMTRTGGGSRLEGRPDVLAVPPIVDCSSASTAYHEIGHAYTWHPQDSVLLAEIHAWRWAMSHALVWNRAMHDDMAAALDSYMVHCNKKDLRDVLEAERLCSDDTFNAECGRREAELLRAGCCVCRRTATLVAQREPFCSPECRDKKFRTDIAATRYRMHKIRRLELDRELEAFKSTRRMADPARTRELLARADREITIAEFKAARRHGA